MSTVKLRNDDHISLIISCENVFTVANLRCGQRRHLTLHHGHEPGVHAELIETGVHAKD